MGNDGYWRETSCNVGSLKTFKDMGNKSMDLENKIETSTLLIFQINIFLKKKTELL